MKKILSIFILSMAGLLVGTNVASASVFSDTQGENPCLFGLSNLKSHGFSENSTYTTEQIHHLLRDIDVEARNVETLAPGQSYQLAYSCYVDHNLARATLQALPVGNPNHVITNIYWSTTKPTF